MVRREENKSEIVHIAVGLALFQRFAIANSLISPEFRIGMIGTAIFVEQPHHSRKKAIAPMRPRRTFVFPLSAGSVHRIEIRIIFDQPLDLLLRKAHGVLEQLSIGFVNELDHIGTRDDNYKGARSGLGRLLTSVQHGRESHHREQWSDSD